MVTNYLHEHPEFDDLIRIVADKLSIAPILVEKDYWIMHCLYGLQQLGYEFYLKGGTSLSKGYVIIHRFSEDIDIYIKPPDALTVEIGKNQNKPAHCESRRKFYDWLATNIKIDGIIEVTRDEAFDDEKYRSGGIRLVYPTALDVNQDIKTGILLEVGFDTVKPYKQVSISSWAYDIGADKVDVRDNRAINVPCYHPGYTFVEKLQTISTKFRQQQKDGKKPANFMRHYYDVFYLLQDKSVQAFIGTPDYNNHKKVRFRQGDEQDLTRNQAFQMQDPEVLAFYSEQYEDKPTLYYKQKPGFDEIINKLREFAPNL